jgi:hypothetical protein
LTLAASTPSFQPYLASALADPSRASDVAIDARRKPGEIIAFSGAKPGDKAVGGRSRFLWPISWPVMAGLLMEPRLSMHNGLE